MQDWSTREGLELLDEFARALRGEEKVIQPGGPIPGDPVDLRGLRFPTVTKCAELELPTVVASRIAGQQKFYDAIIRRADFSESILDFSVWNECRFEHVSFDLTKLRNVRFFGCVFSHCMFRSTDLYNASFSVGRWGVETELLDTHFEKANFAGASCHNPVLRRVRFNRCTFGDFVFESPLCDGVEFIGRYKQLIFRGMPGEPARNELCIDLSQADIFWFDTNHGLDLTKMTLPADGSCMVIRDRVRAVEILSNRLEKAGDEPARKTAFLLRKLYSDRSLSPNSANQTTFLISRRMIEDFAEDSRKEVVDELFERIRTIARDNGFLAA